jgi:hypothetical protein
MVACREDLDDGNEWSFYLINDGGTPMESAVLFAVDYEWGNSGNREDVEVAVSALAPGSPALLWRDDGSGAELRMEFSLRVCIEREETTLSFEFPKLYRLRQLPLVEELGRNGYSVSAEGSGG